MDAIEIIPKATRSGGVSRRAFLHGGTLLLASSTLDPTMTSRLIAAEADQRPHFGWG